ncbi:MAG TPA: beta-ketoacyl-ACP synthase III [Patescibacteria group bacterium]|nr:beta-ketoacyl-ACP synthase III [Patescibacteria group bacterium]
MRKKNAGIWGTGSYLPEKVVTNRDLEQITDTSDEWIVERTGIRERRAAADHQATSDLATQAALRALEAAGVSPEQLDLIIVATVTPDMFFPSTACLVQKNIGAVNSAAFDLSAACSGFLYGMTIGSQFIRNGVFQKVLVIGAECFSRIIDWDDRGTNALFGDGAGAVVLGEVSEGYGILGLDLGADGRDGALLSVPAGGSREPATAETIEQRRHFLQMNGKEVFKFAVKIIGESVNRAVEDAGLDLSDISWLLPHQANVRIIQAAAKRLGFPEEKVLVNIDRVGNTSAASIPILLDENARNGRFEDGDRLAMVGFGAGSTWAAAVHRWCPNHRVQ